MEVWKNIDYGYKVSNFGRVIGPSGKLIKPCPVKSTGYYRFTMHADKRRYPLIHRLVAKHFLPDWDPKLTVDHVDGNKANNNFQNLRMVTRHINVILYHGYGRKNFGVYYHKKSKRWRSRMYIGGKRVTVGTFSTREEAEKSHKLKFIEVHGHSPY